MGKKYIDAEKLKEKLSESSILAARTIKEIAGKVVKELNTK